MMGATVFFCLQEESRLCFLIDILGDSQLEKAFFPAKLLTKSPLATPAVPGGPSSRRLNEL
jgi:hypothetical protein